MPQENLLISIVVPVLNGEKYLTHTLESLRTQTYRNFEVLVIDAGSTDSTHQILSEYSDVINEAVIHPGESQTASLKSGFETLAHGEILGWLCADDLLKPKCLEFVSDFFSIHRDARVVFGDSEYIDADGQHLRVKREMGFNKFLWAFDYNYIPQPSTFWTSSLYREVGGLDSAYRLAMDSDLWAKFSEITTIYHTTEILSSIRLHEEQLTQKHSGASVSEDFQIRKRLMKGSSYLAYKPLHWLARSCRIGLKSLSRKY